MVEHLDIFKPWNLSFNPLDHYAWACSTKWVSCIQQLRLFLPAKLYNASIIDFKGDEVKSLTYQNCTKVFRVSNLCYQIILTIDSLLVSYCLEFSTSIYGSLHEPSQMFSCIIYLKWTSSLNCLFPTLLVFVLKILLRIVIMQKFQVSSIIHLKYANLTILVFGRSQIFRYERTCISLLLNETSRRYIKTNCLIATIKKTRENHEYFEISLYLILKIEKINRSCWSIQYNFISFNCSIRNTVYHALQNVVRVSINLEIIGWESLWVPTQF